MSTVTPPSFGAPDGLINHTALNDVFDAFTSIVDGENIRNDGVQGYHIVQGAVNGSANQVSITGDSDVHAYNGTTYKPLDAATQDLEFNNLIVADGHTLRVHWHTYMYIDYNGQPANIDENTNYKLYWDIGAGMVPVETDLFWQFGHYTSIGVVPTLYEQKLGLNCSGSWCYTNTTGSTLAITKIALYIKPAFADAVIDAYVGWANFIYLVQGR